VKRIVYWVLSTVAVMVLLFSYHTSTSGVLGNSASTSAVSHPFESGTTASDAASTGSRKKTATSKGSRTVTGSVAQTQWGPVQVQLTVTGAKIVDVKVLQYPDGNGRDAEINSYALPILTQETVSAQSASISMVSGATVTSDGYLQSLQSALDQAKL